MSMRNRHRDAIFARSAGMCIYCGGSTPASTIDHMPPTSMFWGRQRPAGLEFPSCAPCNNGANLADLVCAMIGRAYPDAVTDAEKAEVEHYFAAVNNNVPGLLEEMLVPEAKQRRRLARMGLGSEAGGFLRLDGPMVTAHMEAFAARLGLAMHFHETGQILPPEGGVLVRIYSNIDLLEGRVPDDIYSILPAPQTLAAGRKSVDSQFRYGVRATEGQRMSLSFATFRQSFGVLATCASNLANLANVNIPADVLRYRPGALQVLQRPVYRLSFQLSRGA